jgi:uncharacterized membrane protein YqgA involved in biofilm formation
MFIGTIANAISVLTGSTIGSVAGSRFPERIRETVMAGLGLLTAGIGVRELLEAESFVPVLAAVLVGGLIGELLRIETALTRFGDWLQRRLAGNVPEPNLDVELPERDKASPHVPRSFSEGFVVASLVFCIGPLTVLGSINDGLGDPELLFVKAGLDGFASIAFSAIYGWGVALAAVTVLVIQGSIALGAGVLEGVLSDPMIAALASTGGVLLLGISLRLLDLKHIRVANLLPALILAPVFAAL